MQLKRDRMGVRFAASAVMVVALAGAAGCGGGTDEHTRAMEEAARELRSLSVSTTGDLATVEGREKLYAGVITKVRGATGASSVSVAVAAKELTGAAKAGLGQIRASRALKIERDAAAELGRIRLAADVWMSQQSLAESLERYDPSEDLARLTARQQELEASKAEAAQRLAGVNAQIAGLTAASAAELEKAKAERAREAGVRQSAVDQTATRAAELIAEANRIGRAADALDKEASMILTRAAELRPSVSEIEQEIAGIERELELVNGSKAQVEAFVAGNRAAGARSREEASAAWDRIGELLVKVDGLRGEGLNAAWDEAVKYYTEARQAAMDAGRQGDAGNRSKSEASAGAYQQALAEALEARARGLDEFALVVERLATMEPTAPGAAELGEKAKGLRAQADAAMKEAKAAFAQAKDLFARGGGRGRGKELADQLVPRLAGLGGVAVDEAAPEGGVDGTDGAGTDEVAVDDTGAGGDAPTDDGMGTDAVVAADGGGAAVAVQGVLDGVLGAMRGGEWTKLAGFVATGDDEDKAIAEAFGKLRAAEAKVDAAFREHFGQGGLRESGGSPNLGEAFAMEAFGCPGVLTVDVGTLGAVSGADYELTVSGETARAERSSAGERATDLVLVGGEWKLKWELGELLGMMKDRLAFFLSELAGVYEGLSAGIAEGQFGSVEGFFESLSERLNRLIVNNVAVAAELFPAETKPILERMQGSGGG